MRMDEPTLQIVSNLMIDDDEHKPEYRFMPGDYIAQAARWMVDVRTIDEYLSPRQRSEYRQYIVCYRCNRPCAGTCVRNW
jgi:hypothetical protein